MNFQYSQSQTFIIIILNISTQKLNFYYFLIQNFHYYNYQYQSVKIELLIILSLFLKFQSHLPSNDNQYKKINLNNKNKGLLFSLKKLINYPQRVEREIMNEDTASFNLDCCEVFAIKKQQH
eukprot:TRINITY_DN3671_c0_g1_i1.p1 TRINITY_DN3671_c0_g1~~TRINITY_DN3671_c0_g1_i1.p1  ORF type:complete len:122 (-),score=3.38 TRINITY_DN3671_c0_g1_i1:154-519(-)